MFTSPGDVAFRIFSTPVYYYGIIMASALVVGIFTSVFIVKKFYPDLSTNVIYDVSPYIIISAIICARLYYCLLEYEYYFSSPLQILEIRQGGLSIHGAIIGGLIGGVFYAKKHKLPVLKLCDIFSYGLVLGQAIGRWGNFFNSEAFGRPTLNFLKLYIPIYKRPLEYLQYNFFHPTFLYESILDICIFLTLFFVVRKLAKGRDGVVFFSYLILYSIVRILIEQIRIDSVLNVFGIPIAQWVSALLILVSVAAIFVIKFKNENK